MDKNPKSPEQQIAENITKLAENVEALLKGPLNKKALIILLAFSSGQPRRTVDDVLNAIQNLKKDYLNASK